MRNFLVYKEHWLGGCLYYCVPSIEIVCFLLPYLCGSNMGKIKTNKQKSPTITCVLEVRKSDFYFQPAMIWLYGRVNHLMSLSVIFCIYEMKRFDEMTSLILSLYWNLTIFIVIVGFTHTHTHYLHTYSNTMHNWMLMVFHYPVTAYYGFFI